ncbi:MAG: hypothetical protein NTY60_07375 [Proteobacteria bacterium]|nr:hypothetical protein [Pseudomonadota bacterium]
MSFCISNSDRRFVLWLLALVILPVAGLFALGVYLEPLDGDLTRLGFYSERKFGWRDPQQRFPDTQLTFPASQSDTGRYDHYYDVLVLGDSFSYKYPASQWQNYLANSTGLSIATLYIGKLSLSQVLASRIFHQHPPKVIIVESVERMLPDHLKAEKPDYHSPSGNMANESPAFAMTTQSGKRLPGSPQYAERKTPWQEIKLAYVRGFLWHNLVRKLTGREHTKSIRLELNRPAPFSSREQSSTLVCLEDFKKAAWWQDMGVNEMSSRINTMRRQVEANGHTRLILMVPPDKLTAYKDFTRDSKLRNISLLAELSALQADVMPRIDQTLTDAINKGERDVYLPDETHWGSNGQRIAAETLNSFLLRPHKLWDSSGATTKLK